MDNQAQILEEFEVSELEDRVEFGLCGGVSIFDNSCGPTGDACYNRE